MKRFLILMLAFCIIAFSRTTEVKAGEMDLLLEKLVEKGVLTGAEAQQIRIETQEEIKKEIAAGKHEILPQWLQTTKLKGDFRLRYQLDRSKDNNGARTDRSRGRFRLRLGLDSNVNERLMVGLGLASGTNDGSSSTFPNKDATRSTNQSFSNSFSKHPFNLDYAYAKYTATPWLNIIGGKMLLKDAIWEPGDLIYDTDITPEGAAVDLSKKINPNLKLWVKSGVFILDEVSGGNDDPYMAHIQPGADLKVNDNVSLKAAVSTDYFAVKAHALDNSANSNTGAAGNIVRPTGNFFNIVPAFELNFKEPFKGLGVFFLNVQNFRLFGEYVKNLADMNPDEKKSGFMLGFGFGAEKIESRGDWQFSYNYAKLERDSVLDIFPDSDRFEGQTNMRAHEWILQYGLGKNTWLSFDIYRAERLQKPKAPATVVQVDWNMKW